MLKKLPSYLTFFLEQKALGLFKTKEAFLGAVVSSLNGKFSVKKIFKKSHVKPLDISEEDKKLPLITALSAKNVLQRKLDLPTSKKKEIDLALPFEIEPLLPFPLEEAVFYYELIEKTKKTSSVSVFTSLKETVRDHLSSLEEFSLNPDVVSSVPLALKSFSSLLDPLPDSLCLIYLDSSFSCSVFLEKGHLVSYHAIEESFEDATRFRLHFIKTLFALKKESRKEEDFPLLFCGEKALDQTFIHFLTQDLSHPILSYQDFSLEKEDFISYLPFAVPIGLAMRSSFLSEENSDFRQKELVNQNQWKWLLKPLLTTFLFSLLFSFSFFSFGKAYTNYQKKECIKEYLELLSDLYITHDQFEKEFLRIDDEEKIIDVNRLTKEDIEERLVFIEKIQNKTPSLFPLFPNTPKVLDVLSWFVNHPKVSITNFETKEKEALLNLESFSYVLVKKPDLNKPKEPYLVKVDMEFSTDIPKLAREFHDVLIAPNEFVDPKMEVKWSASKGKYRASFYLKDKTNYTKEMENLS